MKMPTSEIIDRYTITLLKSERTDEDVSEELEAYKKESIKQKNTMRPPHSVTLKPPRNYLLEGTVAFKTLKML